MTEGAARCTRPRRPLHEVGVAGASAYSLAAAITEEKEDDFVKQLTESTDKRHSALVGVAPVLCRMRGIV